MRSLLGFVRHDFPPQLTADSSQGARVLISENNEVFRLKCNDEIFVVAPNGHSSPRRALERVVDLVRND